MQLSKKPIVLYDGILSQLKDQDIIGKYQYTALSKNHTDNNTILFAFTVNFIDTTGDSFTLLLPSDPQIGDIIKVIDTKNNFQINNLIINPNTKKIENEITELILDVSGVVITFIYSGEDYGWLLDIGGKSLNIFTDYFTYNIPPSTAGSREGRLVYQIGNTNTVDIADASNNKVPAMGIINHDGDIYVHVRKSISSIINVQPDPEAIINVGDHLFLSFNGTVTNDDDHPSMAVCQRIGRCYSIDDNVKVNFMPSPEIYKSLDIDINIGTLTVYTEPDGIGQWRIKE